MTTPADIVDLALKMSGTQGVGQSPLPEDTNDAFTMLNQIIGQWNRKRYLLFHMKDVSFVSTGAATYSVGSSGNFVTDYPERIDAAFIRYVNQTPNANRSDYPLTIITSREDWSQIVVKSQVGFPQYAFYDATFPQGTLYLWPIATAAVYEIHITVKAQLTFFTSLTQDINLPGEYAEAMIFTLASRLRPAYLIQPDPILDGLAKASLETIRMANADVPVVTMDATLTLKNGGYNIFSDGYGIRQ